jgi:hypothetical protein
MGSFYNNIGMSVNILAATNTGNNRRTAVSIRRPVNTFLLKNVTTIGNLANISTVALRVIGGNENGSLESETLKYGHESHGTRTRE